MASVSSVLSCDKGRSFPADEMPRDGTAAPLGGSVFRQTKRVQRKPPGHWLFVKCLNLKGANILKRHVLGWHVLNSSSHILEWHILPPFTTIKAINYQSPCKIYSCPLLYYHCIIILCVVRHLNEMCPSSNAQVYNAARLAVHTAPR